MITTRGSKMSDKPSGLARLGLNAIGLYVGLIIVLIFAAVLSSVAEFFGVFFIPLLAVAIWGFFRWQARRDEK